MRCLFRVKLEFGVVEVDACDGGIGFCSGRDLGRLSIVDEDGEATQDDGFDFEEIVRMHPD